MSVGFTPSTYQDIRQLISEAFAEAAGVAANDDVGSVLGAIFNAVALAITQQQRNIITVQAAARIVTSQGGDLDSVVAPFGYTRLSATPASGQVVFSTASAVATTLVVPVGAIVTTNAGLQFAVIADPTNSAYSAASNGYPIAIGQSSVSATVQCVQSGAIGNVGANQITLPFSNGTGPILIGISSLTNPSAFVNAIDDETDTALLARFTTGMSSGTVSTANALGATILALQSGLTYSIGDQLDSSGAAKAAWFTAVVNIANQNQAPPSTLLNNATTALNAVRSAGIGFSVIAPTLVPVNVGVNLKLKANANSTNVVSLAAAALTSLLNGIGLDPAGATTYFLVAEAYATLYAIPGVQNIVPGSLTFNGTTAADISAAFAHQIVSGTHTITTS